MYTLIKMMYYKYLPPQFLPEVHIRNPEERAMVEFEQGEKAMESMHQDVEFVMNGRFCLVQAHGTSCARHT